eukprot:TRINITY_DN2285_c0_g1_i3.p1 TRINITY_DN2285_c0_g1~~TRINITY_DN2285_c0_g1_i3.p1  ORF type:complete len:301 (+),score=110.43 TRINITY_DN2285_c0_g1_i3:69-971(+)
MVFLVSVGTDLYGRKYNAKLEFAERPSLAEFVNAVEAHYDTEARAHRPAGYPDVPYRVETMQVYDDVRAMRWVDLHSAPQLVNGAQTFCFQPESIWHSDAQDIIPEGAQAVTWKTPSHSPRRVRVPQDSGLPPALSEKLRSVFHDISAGKGFVLYSDLRAAFDRCDIEFTYSTVGELFTTADTNRSGHITYEEWVRFAIHFPQVVDALYFRSRDVQRQRVGPVVRDVSAAAAVAAQTAALDRAVSRAAADSDAAAAKALREAELRRLYEEQWAAAERGRMRRALSLGNRSQPRAGNEGHG